MAKSNFEYSRHILEQMARRGIRKKQVEEAVLDAEERIPQGDKVIRATHNTRNKKLIVVYRPEGNKIKLITTFYEN